ncbi:thiol reductant ABC exporter subunit CydC [Rhodococcus sp. BP-252]|uniref:thiol reductant ABC exporter subunit CydC n=1 Tax=unclassified Rhodococcus (in: high G+C Gram-positive bacteria) TaxID=192944 RepID=UPI001C9B5F5B|nr:MULTISPECIES: thiol reductant ABC exporter subunit CydC [unclassified Rhodococcus (in: high G+C Gram-positive bacteria)]MBY6412740.1 thiol reductant ABC exporter subunit CydC [Rhodococcus sp. BP-320]MBY6417462.1 thiol reductant ABC exporter subunit CydC [Rhodococcus sp. BP-321]MBY6421760.1 thiol reductant ABC exporter subunit CydC [Rhodococcus sp. BP-324]MBY6427499.1 thiol reductant ABC exporter subunit CydC [Rhodococcus sp. BP-323]MBY6432650.1 thiol reductant ABC exporter subunit CydC [Rho
MSFRDLRRATSLLELEPKRVALSVAAGVATLGSALTLAAVSAWLITRAWQMPPVLDLTVAVVAVRALGISRGVFRYLERLATHDTALRGTTAARTRLYERLASGQPAAAAGLRRGDLMTRTGADVDVLGDVVVKAVVPILVSTILMVAAVVLLGFVSIGAAAILFGALVIAGVLAPILAARSASIHESEGVRSRSEFAEAAVRALDHGAELRVAGRLTETLDEMSAANRRAVRAKDRAATSGAFADAALPLSIGASVLGSLLVGIGLYGPSGGAPGGMTPMALAIIVLVPLAAFEATSALPAAATALTRARLSASRIVALLDEAGRPAGPIGSFLQAPLPPIGSFLHTPLQQLDGLQNRVGAVGLHCGWPGSTVVTRQIDLDLPAGSRVAVVGPSGSGKTTLLMTLAGLLPPVAGSVDAAGAVFFAEDAHLFETTILENLRVVRGDVDADTARAVLDKVGLGQWIDSVPNGVDTVLAGGADAVSGGQRRRILLARPLLSEAPILLLDEPTEHLDDEGGAQLLRALLDARSGLVDPGRTVVLVTHQLPERTGADLVVDLSDAAQHPALE